MAGTHLPFGSLSTQRRTLQRKRGYWLPEGKRLAVETSVPSQRTPGSILAVGRTRIRRPLAPNQGPPEESHRPRGSRHVIKTALTSCLTGEGTKPRFLPERSLQSQPSAAGRQTHARPESRLSTLAPRELNCHYVLGHDEITHEQELLILPKESEAAVGGGGGARQGNMPSASPLTLATVPTLRAEACHLTDVFPQVPKGQLLSSFTAGFRKCSSYLKVQLKNSDRLSLEKHRILRPCHLQPLGLHL